MTQKILPGDFILLVDNAVIRTKCPPDLVTDAMVAGRCHAANLSAGDTVLVQCFDHSKEVLLAWATYMIVGLVERKKHVEIDDRSSRSFNERNYEIECIVPWRVPASLIEPEPQVTPQSLQRREEFIPADCRRMWNPSAQLHEIRRKDNDELVTSHKDKDIAERIASGELPFNLEPVE